MTVFILAAAKSICGELTGDIYSVGWGCFLSTVFTWQSCTALLKKLSRSKFCSSASRSKASLILPRNTLDKTGKRTADLGKFEYVDKETLSECVTDRNTVTETKISVGRGQKGHFLMLQRETNISSLLADFDFSGHTSTYFLMPASYSIASHQIKYSLIVSYPASSFNLGSLTSSRLPNYFIHICIKG